MRRKGGGITWLASKGESGSILSDRLVAWADTGVCPYRMPIFVGADSYVRPAQCVNRGCKTHFFKCVNKKAA
jgi:hypothetical protein